ncbi:hypothetical protein [Candidatus Magnetaquiglobus chichijimensis]|uniref:hypothetical protein n=1 Tax=Candidatus Magnetaquiglobus chichijimensis TaxID=3141448 RepID=UPI003B978720
MSEHKLPLAAGFFGPCSRDCFAKDAKQSRGQGGAQRFFAKGAKKRFFEERAKSKSKELKQINKK